LGVVISWKIHAQVTSTQNCFPALDPNSAGEPNSHVSLVDAAMPGMLPVINEFLRRAGGAHRAPG